MSNTNIIVISPSQHIADFLRESLDETEYHIIHCNPGVEIVRRAYQARIAVIDRIDERPDMAQMEVALIKKHYPEVPIIVIGHHSSEQDAAIVNQGIFFYLVGYSEQKLLRVLYAATDAVNNKDTTTFHPNNSH